MEAADAQKLHGTDRGAWYAALATETCLAEVGFHLTQALAEAGDYNAVVDYAELFASLAGEFVDLRGAPDHPALAPDGATGYPAGHALAAATRRQGINGIICPSVRQKSGTCLVALWPHVVQSVAQGGVVRLTWAGAGAGCGAGFVGMRLGEVTFGAGSGRNIRDGWFPVVRGGLLENRMLRSTVAEVQIAVERWRQMASCLRL